MGEGVWAEGRVSTPLPQRTPRSETPPERWTACLFTAKVVAREYRSPPEVRLSPTEPLSRLLSHLGRAHHVQDG